MDDQPHKFVWWDDGPKHVIFSADEPHPDEDDLEPVSLEELTEEIRLIKARAFEALNMKGAFRSYYPKPKKPKKPKK